jgi:hypothetical protein
MMGRRRLAALAVLVAAPAVAETFGPADIAAWTAHSFEGETAYETVTLDGEPALEARCDASASGRFLEREIDLTATPIIEWRWRVDDGLPPVENERAKAGDDFAARLYVVREGFLPWQSRAVNYVWAATAPAGADWPNPFASQAHMVALQSGPGGGWRTERRDIRADFARFHGVEADTIDVVAIMTDCDNTGGTARAWYGEIRLLPGE